MFQYAAGLALAERWRTTLKLDVSWYGLREGYAPHNRYALSCFNITEQFASEGDLTRLEPPVLTRTERWSVALARLLRLRSYVRRHVRSAEWHRQPGSSYYAGFETLPDGSAIDGYFQSEKFFAPVAPLLRLHFSFRYPPSAPAARLAQRIASGPSIGLHFRRGDYARNPHFSRDLGVLGPGYYHHALRLLRERSPQAMLYVFSDDIEAAAREFKPEGPHEFVRCIEPWHDHDSLRLLSLCEHVAIANSSFSWWAAWLNPAPDRLVIAPAPWFTAPDQNPADIVPSGWTRLSRNGETITHPAA